MLHGIRPEGSPLPLAHMPPCRHLMDALYTFEEADSSDFQLWRDAMLWFLKKVGRH